MSGMMKGVTIGVVVITAILLIITILLVLSLKRQNGQFVPDSMGGYFPADSKGYVHPDGTVSQRKIGYTSTSSGVYIAPPGSGYRPPGSSSNSNNAPNGYRPPDGNSNYGNPPPAYQNQQERDSDAMREHEVNFDPTKFKQPNYDDFFNDKPRKHHAADKMADASTPDTKPKKQPDSFMDVESLDTIETPENILPTKTPQIGDDWDDTITPPDISSLADKGSLDAYKPADTEFFFPKSESQKKAAEEKDDSISDIDLSQYLSMDYLSKDDK
jgi:hypothetical protein